MKIQDFILTKLTNHQRHLIAEIVFYALFFAFILVVVISAFLSEKPDNRRYYVEEYIGGTMIRSYTTNDIDTLNLYNAYQGEYNGHMARYNHRYIVVDRNN